MLRVGIGNWVSLTHLFRVLILESCSIPRAPRLNYSFRGGGSQTVRGDTQRTPTLAEAQNAPRCPGGSRGHFPPGTAPVSLRPHVRPTLRKDQAQDSACTRSHLECGGALESTPNTPPPPRPARTTRPVALSPPSKTGSTRGQDPILLVLVRAAVF